MVLWRNPTSTSSSNHHALCTPYTLPAGVLIMPSATQTIAPTAIFSPACSHISGSLSNASLVSSSALKDPFYSSVIPVAYTIAGTTVLAWVLLCLLLVTPQRRPYLQKIATLTVAVSLTIALAESSKILKSQYDLDYDDADELRSYMDDGLVLKICKVISDVFLWLAQVQTLIRLFPRHREKKIIKWLGLVLIVIDTVFWSLKSFLPTKDDDKSFRDAIPALAYLFQIILSLLYCGYVVYYSISKRAFAYHARNLLLAILSLVAVLTPIIFFLLDISRQWISGWGDFVRWVGAAAASVVVWEWVERIESLESKMQESGVLGRQVFEEEMLETGTSRGARASRVLRRGQRRTNHDRRDHTRNDDESFSGGDDDSTRIWRSQANVNKPQRRRRRRQCARSHTNDLERDGTANEDQVNDRDTRSGDTSLADAEKESKTRVNSDDYDDDNSDHNANSTSPGFAHSMYSFFESGVALLFGRSISRATTGTSATTYRVNNNSSSITTEDVNNLENGRVRHFYPLKRGLSYSTHSTSPASFAHSADNHAGINYPAHFISRPETSQYITPSAAAAAAAAASTTSATSPADVTVPLPALRGPSTNSHPRGSPVPSVSFCDSGNIRSTPPGDRASNSVHRSSPISSMTENKRRQIRNDAHDDDSVVKEQENIDEHGHGHSYSDSDEFDDYMVYGDAANSEAVLRNSRSSHVGMITAGSSSLNRDYAEQPPAFERIPGYNDGDYWDEKDPMYHVHYNASRQQEALRQQERQQRHSSLRNLPEAGIAPLVSENPPIRALVSHSHRPRPSRRDHRGNSTTNTGDTGNSHHQTLEPRDTGRTRQFFERLTGARDWVVNVAEPGDVDDVDDNHKHNNDR
ncbi:PalH/RIM21-domain-containing protein [Lipomyces japonicus]|uniref:PalH/RIM21-domain-containing protein n=1 Tax=Lipomyces japonicus TaxID=56871 RepID=UPI0034CD6410